MDRAQASLGYRAGASLVDLGVAGICGLVAACVAAYAAAPDLTVQLVGLVTCLVATFAQPILVGGATNGQTIGKHVAGIRIVRDDGAPYGYGTAALRDGVFRLLASIPVIGFIDPLWALGEERQTLRDRMIATHVLREPEYRARRWPLTGAAVAAVIGLSVLWTLAEPREPLAYPGTVRSADERAFDDLCRANGASDEVSCGCAFSLASGELGSAGLAAALRTRPEEWPEATRDALGGAFASCA